MNIGTPTPAFYAIVVVLVLALVAAAVGKNPVAVFFASLFGTYLAFIVFTGSPSSFAMAAGWGILVMIPTSAGCAAAVGIGMFVHKERMRRKVIGKEEGAPKEDA